MEAAIVLPLLWAVIAAATAELAELTFTKYPESVTAPVGDEVTFECAVNVPGERLAWRWRPAGRPGDAWRDAPGNSDRDHITTRLLVKIREDTESALYQCVVWYGAISLASDPARLTVARMYLSRNSAEKRIITAPLHNPVVLHCKEPASEPPAVLTWWKEVSPGIRVPVETMHGVLVIHNATTEDSGTYGCTATNELSGQELDLPETTYLKVQHEGPGGVRFLETEEFVGQVDSDGGLTVPVQPSAALRLWCGVVGTPPPRVTWSKGNEKRTSFRHDYDLIVQPFTTEDEGIYSCEAIGIRRSWKAIALQAPYWDGSAAGVNVSEGESAVVSCGTPIGQPPPTIHWMLNAEPIHFGREIKTVGSELRIARVEKRHAGAVQCFACNLLGCAHDAALLTVVPKQISDLEYIAENAKASNITYQPPFNKKHNRKGPKRNKAMVPPSRPNVTRMSDESVMVTWSNSSVGMPIQIFKVQFREVTNSSDIQWQTATSDIPPYIHSYEVDQLIPDRYYKFRIAAVYSNLDNKPSRSSAKFYLQRGGIKGPRAPVLTSAVPLSPTSVRLNWTWSSGGGIEAEGFYVYYRAVSSAGKYEKVTASGGAGARSMDLGYLAPDTAYELKVQSYTAQAPSEFSSILVAKTLRSATAAEPTAAPPAADVKEPRSPGALVTAGGALGAAALLVILVVTLLLCRRAKRPSANKEKGSAPESGGANGYIPAKVPITITANPMHAEGGDGGVEMSFLHNNNCGNPASNDDTLPRTRKNGPTSRQYV